ncbi:hypothetical protein T492DRAFT_181487, partial [Pavlovales sp. CCMP2436]
SLARNVLPGPSNRARATGARAYQAPSTDRRAPRTPEPRGSVMQIPFLPGYPRPDYTKTNFRKQQLCAVRQGASFVQRPPGSPIVPSAVYSAAGAPPMTPPHGLAAGAYQPQEQDRHVAWALGTSVPTTPRPASAAQPPPTPPPSASRVREHSQAAAELGVPGGWTAAEAQRAREFKLGALMPAQPRWTAESHEATLSFHGYFREAVDAGEPEGCASL